MEVKDAELLREYRHKILYLYGLLLTFKPELDYADIEKDFKESFAKLNADRGKMWFEK